MGSSSNKALEAFDGGGRGLGTEISLTSEANFTVLSTEEASATLHSKTLDESISAPFSSSKIDFLKLFLLSLIPHVGCEIPFPTTWKQFGQTVTGLRLTWTPGSWEVGLPTLKGEILPALLPKLLCLITTKFEVATLQTLQLHSVRSSLLEKGFDLVDFDYDRDDKSVTSGKSESTLSPLSTSERSLFHLPQRELWKSLFLHLNIPNTLL